MSKVQKFISDMINKPWLKEENNVYSDSNLLLLKEHFRRMMLWSNYLHVNFSWEFDVIENLQPQIELPKDIMEVINTLGMRKGETKMTIRNVARWYYFIDTEGQANLEDALPLPYEAADLWLRQGGAFRFDKERMEVYSAMEMKTYKRGEMITYDLSIPNILDSDNN